MFYSTNTVTLRTRVSTYDDLCMESEKIEIMLSLILGEIITDHERYDVIDHIDIKRQSRETDYLSEICYNFNNRELINSIIKSYSDKDDKFTENHLLLREYFYHDLENIIVKLNTDLIIDYIFINPMTILFNFIVVD